MNHQTEQAPRGSLTTGWLMLTGGLGLVLAVRAWCWDSESAPAEMPSAPRYQVNLNQASVAEFQALPEIGPRLAERIVRDRKANGPFLTPEQLSRVRGVGPATLERIGPYLQYPQRLPASAAEPQQTETP